MANKQLNAVITIGGTVTGALKNALGSTQSKLRAIGSAVRDLEKEQKRLVRGMRDGMQMGKPVADLHEKYQSVTRQIEKARHEQERMNRAVKGMDAGKAKMGAALGVIGATVAVAATAGLPIVQAAQFETAMLGVAKQVEGARDESGQLTQVYYDMAKQVQLLGREIPLATNEIAAMVAAGARMGVAKDELIGFTRTAGMMASAFELPADELADSMGKIAGLYKIPIPAIGELADAVNYLDDNAISKGGDIIDYLTRTGGAASAVKVTGKEMTALGSTLLTLGERTETAGTATNALFTKLAAADKGTKKFRGALTEIGMSADAIQKGMQVDAQGTILQVLDAVNKMPQEKRLGVLVDMIGLEHSDTVAKLAGNMGEYRKQIALVNSERAKGSMAREFGATAATAAAQWEITKNKLTEVSVNIGSVLLPPVNKFMTVIGDAASAVADFSRENPVLVKNIAAVIGAVAGAALALNTVKLAFGGVTTGIHALKFAMMTNPIGLAVGAIAIGAALIYTNWEPIKGFFVGLWGGIKNVAGAAWDFLQNYILPFTPLGIIVQNWEPIGAFFGMLWDGVKFAANAVWTWLKDAFLNWTPLGLVIKNWEPITNFFSGMFTGIKNVAGEAIDWVLKKIGMVGDAWQSTKRFFGLKADEPFSASTMWKIEQAPPPPAPRMATDRRGGGTNFTDNSSHKITIKPLPGQNPQQIARETVRQIGASNRARQGSMLYDRAGG